MKKEFSELVAEWNPSLEIGEVLEMTPDASQRRYFRLSLSDGTTAVVMKFDSLSSAEIDGAENLTPDMACVEGTKFFLNQGIPVPKLYSWRQNPSELLIEDLGDVQLGKLLEGGKSEIEGYYKKAIDLILLLQSIPTDNSYYGFNRKFTKDIFIKEMEEFSDFYLPTKGKELDLQNLYTKIADEILTLPFVLSHRDFHSWNLIVDPSAELRLIDFQDACLAPITYDLISLLHDRDTDSLLGEALLTELKNYFFDKLEVSVDQELSYRLVSLQRDLKVAGRFAKLSAQRGLSSYEKWIPGTVSRVKTNLSFLAQRNADRELSSAYELIFGE